VLLLGLLLLGLLLLGLLLLDGCLLAGPGGVCEKILGQVVDHAEDGVLGGQGQGLEGAGVAACGSGVASGRSGHQAGRLAGQCHPLLPPCPGPGARGGAGRCSPCMRDLMLAKGAGSATSSRADSAWLWGGMVGSSWPRGVACACGWAAAKRLGPWATWARKWGRPWSGSVGKVSSSAGSSGGGAANEVVGALEEGAAEEGAGAGAAQMEESLAARCWSCAGRDAAAVVSASQLCHASPGPLPGAAGPPRCTTGQRHH
jgi:hypothetical protein